MESDGGPLRAADTGDMQQSDPARSELSIEELYADYSARVSWWLRGWSVPERQIEDLTQEIFLVAFRGQSAPARPAGLRSRRGPRSQSPTTLSRSIYKWRWTGFKASSSRPTKRIGVDACGIRFWPR